MTRPYNPIIRTDKMDQGKGSSYPMFTWEPSGQNRQKSSL